MKAELMNQVQSKTETERLRKEKERSTYIESLAEVDRRLAKEEINRQARSKNIASGINIGAQYESSNKRKFDDAQQIRTREVEERRRIEAEI